MMSIYLQFCSMSRRRERERDKEGWRKRNFTVPAEGDGIGASCAAQKTDFGKSPTDLKSERGDAG